MFLFLKNISWLVYFICRMKKKIKKIYEEILSSNNSFYSTLALSNILEKNLENNKDKILEYFKKVEKLQENKDQKDILNFKKSIIFIKKFKRSISKKYLKNLMNSNSSLKNLAEEILVN